MFAVPAALALLCLPTTGWRRVIYAVLGCGVGVAIITSEARVDVLAGVIAVIAFAGLTATGRAGGKTLLGIGVGVTLAVTVLSVVIADTQPGSFSRYESISNPKEALVTAYNYRGSVIAEVPKYAVKIPFGAGFGSRGPAGSFGGGKQNEFNGESEPTYLQIEVGLPGLIVMTGFNLALLFISLTRIRVVADRETRIMLAAIAAPLFALFAGWFAGVATATSPGSPYLWFAAGVLSWWLLGGGSRAVAAKPRPLRETRWAAT